MSYSDQSTTRSQVRELVLYSRHLAFQTLSIYAGTYLIDPCLPFSPVAAGMSGKSECRDRSLERRHVRNTQRAFGSVPGIDGSTGWCRGRKEIPELHGAFRTRNAAISLDVGIAEPETEQAAQVGGKVTGRIMASSLHGRVSVNLVSRFSRWTFGAGIVANMRLLSLVRGPSGALC